MIRNSSLYVALTISGLAFAGCGENATEPETTRPRSSTVPAFAVASDSWITRADMPRARFMFAMAAVANAAGDWIVYVMGGMTPRGGISTIVQAYNVTTNRWTMTAPLPIRLYRPNGAGVINGKLYLAGGITIRRTALADLFVYNPATDTWTRKASMPSTGFSGVTGVINGRLYVLTGCTGFGADCEPQPFVPLAFYRYNPVTDQWATLPTPTSTHRRAMAGVIGGKFYVAGGENGGKKLEVYDPATNQWTTKKPMSQERWSGAGVALRAKLYVIGGLVRDPDGTVRAIRTTSVYDPATDAWTRKAPLPIPLGDLGGSRVVLNGKPRIEVVGEHTNLQYIP